MCASQAGTGSRNQHRKWKGYHARAVLPLPFKIQHGDIMDNKIALAGCDVSKDHLDLCLQLEEGRRKQKRFKNMPAGHDKLIQWLHGGGRELPVRVVVEATGTYSLDLALALHAAEHIDIMVANPMAIKKFAEAQMQRSKTDRLDAQILCDFAARMPFHSWRPPSEDVVALRGIARRLQALTTERTRELSRLRHAKATQTTPQVVINDIEVNVRHLERRLKEMLCQAQKLVRSCATLRKSFDHLTSVGGIGEKSAVVLLAELLVLPAEMSVRQWVAHAGLDPRKHESGSSVRRRERISKVGNVRLRRALYMPALVAIRCEPHVRAFYNKLLKRGKQPKVAIVAVMRKLLHAIYGMLRHDADFQGEKFYRIPARAT